MTKTSLLLPVFLGMALSAAADDLIMLRNGDELTGKVSKISDKEIAFTVKSGGLLFKIQSPEQLIPTNDVYMVKTEKRGTTFFVDGKRIMRENVKSDKSADYIYLVSGEEIPGWQLSLQNGNLYYRKQKAQKKALSNADFIPIDQVFLVKYSDGSKDLFTDITTPPAPVTPVQEEVVPSMKVVFHEVLRGETLATIAEKYGVEVEQIKEWNEIPSKYSAAYVPKAGTQLMLHVKIAQ